MWLKRLQLALIHIAVAITLLPINSTLNRVMIRELEISATVVAIFVSLPYLFSPIQIAIGSYADRHPILGRRRMPYIALGLALCIGGAMLAPLAAFTLAEGGLLGFLFSLLAFGAWGMGFNFATVSYFSLASELWDEKGRTRTISVMFFLMIVSIIVMAVAVSRMVTPYTPEALQRAFWMVGGVAAVLGVLGLIGLEKPFTAEGSVTPRRHSWGEMVRAVAGNRQARLFFIYLILLLAAILGQDVLLEPFAGEAFDMPVQATTRITSIWGLCVLAALIAAGFLQTSFGKRGVAYLGGIGALSGFILIAVSGMLRQSGVFYAGVVLLGTGTGLATVSNLSLMLDMTAVGNVGLFMGAWGVADALSRLAGSVMGGAVRDVITQFAANPVAGYVAVFGIEAAMLVASLMLLRWIDSRAFQRSVEGTTTLAERAALMGEMQS
jgi:BCD family chlorophyll transporter-like MFS transporter